ncbi:hypothetical protein [Legionella spiritensis]|uniref:hypothetical protein n=1 Tax=Legionella spiritensis TaxID=452 RepID=UPI000F706F51|nr:hypothetical protein [Legionella spiritensis]VEG89683.1 Predicted glycosyl hydrolase [Legionella spiritensis]
MGLFFRVLLFCIPMYFPGYSAWAKALSPDTRAALLAVDNQTFRDEIIHYVRDVAVGRTNPDAASFLQNLDALWFNHYQSSAWEVYMTVFYKGQVTGEGNGHGNNLVAALKQATESSLSALPAGQLTEKELEQYRFKVTFDYYPAKLYSFIEYGSKGLELTGSRVAVRHMDKVSLQKQIADSQRYLLQSMNPKYHGFFKFYYAGKDQSEELLRTIYSSSSLYTLLELYQYHHDPQLPQYFKPIADFILSNQVVNGPHQGGFYYGFDPKTRKRTGLVVVGTTSKTIFTLLELHRFYPSDPQYLAAAKKGGDWLLTRVRKDGGVIAVARMQDGQWRDNEKQSLLYSGQVLSALSRLYAVTRDPRYYDGAKRIAGHFLARVKNEGTLLGDDYRSPNSISTSWVMMSLIDFAKVDQEPVYRETIERLAATLLSRQITDKDDIFNNGRYFDAMTTSGNGWINEVMGVLYDFCRKNRLAHCQRYQTAMLLTGRWLLQNAYNEENTYNIKNPERAIGGFITNFTSSKVRTDAVCHGLNSLVMLMESAASGEPLQLKLPERPLVKILPLLRAGKGFISNPELCAKKNQGLL